MYLTYDSVTGKILYALTGLVNTTADGTYVPPVPPNTVYTSQDIDIHSNYYNLATSAFEAIPTFVVQPGSGYTDVSQGYNQDDSPNLSYYPPENGPSGTLASYTVKLPIPDKFPTGMTVESIVRGNSTYTLTTATTNGVVYPTQISFSLPKNKHARVAVILQNTYGAIISLSIVIKAPTEQVDYIVDSTQGSVVSESCVLAMYQVDDDFFQGNTGQIDRVKNVTYHWISGRTTSGTDTFRETDNTACPATHLTTTYSLPTLYCLEGECYYSENGNGYNGVIQEHGYKHYSYGPIVSYVHSSQPTYSNECPLTCEVP